MIFFDDKPTYFDESVWNEKKKDFCIMQNKKKRLKKGKCFLLLFLNGFHKNSNQRSINFLIQSYI